MTMLRMGVDMSRSAFEQITDTTSTAGGELQLLAPGYRNEPILIDSVANNVGAQCLHIAARRGRQIRLAREQADQQRTDSPSLDGAEVSPPNEA